MRPLSDPGAAGRLAPFVGAAIIALLLVLLPASASDWSLLAAAAILTTILLAAALLVPWVRLPTWCQATLPLAFFPVVVLLRQAGGGATSGYSPLVMLPILWLAIYGSRTQLWAAIAATAATFVAPLVLVGPPAYPNSGWREAVIWVSMGALAGFATYSLVNESRHRTADVAALGALTRALNAGSDPRPELCAAAKLVTAASFAVLFEPHLDGTLVATTGTEGIDLERMRMDPRSQVSAAAQAWRTGERLYLADAANDPRASGRMNQLTGARGALCQPITRGHRRMGVLVIGFRQVRQHLPATALELVELLAAEMGAAIDRADLVAELSTQSHTDSLTGATNRRGWDEAIDRELAHAHRSAEPLTVAIIDMDHFKAYNDNHGHLAGDVLLKNLVIAIRAELRTGDVIARWGGEEFALALPNCDLQQAQTIASRLLKIVPGAETASIGMTQAWPLDTPRALIERADRALYTAKNGGRNQVQAYQGPPTLGLVMGQAK